VATKPFRFGVQSFSADSGEEWAGRVQRAEALGYSAFHLADHLIGPGPALEQTAHPAQSLAAIPAMAYAAAVTEKIHIGCRVFCIDYHQPIVLAKSAMTIDRLSGGRLELGLGAGWLKAEYDAIGMHFDEPSVRIDRLADVIEAIRAYGADGEINVDNASVRWRDFEAVPKPVSKPPLMIGGGSQRGGGHCQPEFQQSLRCARRRRRPKLIGGADPEEDRLGARRGSGAF
jgi:alkanesulfonate monooxygenase SsuD/methylene tetrahydromethanopterin reductase-like flavin-dependent oxidoreductase (luciferase family)